MHVTTLEGESPRVQESGTRTPRFRRDIQGLRAIAVGIVLLYHLWPNRIPGGFVGVDVFFVISGFLITSHLITKPPRSWSDVVAFWARRIRRLLPASLLVLFTTGVATYLVAPQSIWVDTGRQITAAALYVVNWDFARSSVDYLAADNAPSPVQHFWSLSVEEQFYFIWPLIILAAFLAGKRFWKPEHAVGVVIGMIFAVSLGFSVWFTSVQPAAAYFVTPTRMWELAAGGVVAYFVICIRPARLPFSTVIGWVGLAGIAFGAFTIRSTMPFPGAVALVPVVSTALVILADSNGRTSVLPLLSLKPVQFLGNVSYSVYLWHWPMIVLVPYLSVKLGFSENLGRLDKALIIAVSIVLAWLSMEFIENRFRRSLLLRTSGRTLGFAAVAMVLVCALGLSQMWVANTLSERNENSMEKALADPDSCIGGEVLLPGAGDDAACASGDDLLMEPATAKKDKSKAYADGCWSSSPYTKRPTCTYGDGKIQVALVGNSHAGQWLPALEVLAEQNDWTITTFLASNCGNTTLPQDLSTNEAIKGCQEYGKWATEQTSSGKFDAVVTSERQSVPLNGKSWDQTAQEAPSGHRTALQSWTDAGVDVAVIRDTPYPGAEDINVPDCLAAHEDDPSQCSGTPETWYWMDPLADEAERLESERVSVIYPEPWFCPDGTCEPAIGGVITYFDTAHITATYATTLAPQLEEELRRTGLEAFVR